MMSQQISAFLMMMGFGVVMSLFYSFRLGFVIVMCLFCSALQAAMYVIPHYQGNRLYDQYEMSCNGVKYTPSSDKVITLTSVLDYSRLTNSVKIRLSRRGSSHDVRLYVVTDTRTKCGEGKRHWQARVSVFDEHSEHGSVADQLLDEKTLCVTLNPIASVIEMKIEACQITFRSADQGDTESQNLVDHLRC